MDNSTKCCPRCKRLLSLAEFSKNQAQRDGLHSQCKGCNYTWRQEHAEQHTDRCRKWRQEHREEIAIYNHNWQLEHPDYNRKYQKEHPAVGCASQQRRRARKAALPPELNTFTAQEWQEALDTYKYKCYYCGAKETKKRKLTQDHRVPLDNGGSNTKDNIVPACLKCNQRKHTRDELSFLMRVNQEEMVR